MRKFISFKTAANANLIILGLFVIFHALVILEVTPQSIVWGGRLTSRDELVQHEVLSIVLMSVCIFITLLKANYIPLKLKIIPAVGMWFMVVLFLFNTVGNIFAITLFEKLAFTPMTILLTLFSLRLAIEKES